MTPLGFEGAVLRSLNSVAGYRDRCEANGAPTTRRSTRILSR